MKTFKIRLEGATELISGLSKTAPYVKQNMRSAMFDVTEKIKADAKDNAPVGVSAPGTKKAIFSEVSEFRGVVGVDHRVKHAYYAEFGREPGKMPPIEQFTKKEEPLDKWVRLKLGVKRKRERMGIALFIARKIARHGTKGQPFLIPAFEKNIKYATDRFQKALDDAIKFIVS